jgi:hypothetical protein
LKNLKLCWLLLAVLVLFVPLLRADTVTVQLTGVNGVNDGHYYVSPYFGTINGQPVVLFCNDVLNSVSIGQSWQANLSTITAESNLSLTRYGNLPSALMVYQEAAWLTTQFQSHPSEYVNLQHAIWYLFTSNLAFFTEGSGSWVALAQQNYTNISYDNFRVVTNAPPPPVQLTGQIQEYITTVPEPATLTMLGMGLSGIAFLCRRKPKS